jgi:small-conductance mechanosensitive channel
LIGGYDMPAGQFVLIPLVILCGFLLLVWLVRKITVYMQQREMDANIVQVVSHAIYIADLIILGITTLDLINVPLTAFAFVSGAITIGVGFGFGAQYIINNFING